MFLEDKLTQKLEDRSFDPDFMIQSLMNVCIDHIAERISPSTPHREMLQVVKQTDIIWRTWSKKNFPTAKALPEMFRREYIVPRLWKYAIAEMYFKITSEEIEKYGKEKQ